jgi:hypothetical protein
MNLRLLIPESPLEEARNCGYISYRTQHEHKPVPAENVPNTYKYPGAVCSRIDVTQGESEYCFAI